MQLNEASLAVGVFDDVLRFRDEEPQSYHDLGLAFEKDGRYNDAAAQFLTIMNRSWNGRFPEVVTDLLLPVNIGQEEFILPNAAAGEYKIKTHYYGNRQQNVARPTTIQVNLFTNYGSAKEEQKSVTMRLSGPSRVVDVGSIDVN